MKLFIKNSKNVFSNGIFSEEQFHEILKSERERSDRSSLHFSMVLFDLQSLNRDGNFNPQLLDNIKSTVREIDKVGWYDNRRIGILLPYTTGEGAYKLIEKLVHALKINKPISGFTVYTYPLN